MYNLYSIKSLKIVSKKYDYIKKILLFHANFKFKLKNLLTIKLNANELLCTQLPHELLVPKTNCRFCTIFIYIQNDLIVKVKICITLKIRFNLQCLT